MYRDPFDEFRKMREKMRKMMEGKGSLFGGAGYSISLQKADGKTRVDIRGDFSDAELDQLEQKYPSADIYVNGNKVSGEGPVEVIDEGEEDSIEEEPQRQKVELVEEEPSEEDLEPEELALKRFHERKKEKKGE